MAVGRKRPCPSCPPGAQTGHLDSSLALWHRCWSRSLDLLRIGRGIAAYADLLGVPPLSSPKKNEDCAPGKGDPGRGDDWNPDWIGWNPHALPTSDAALRSMEVEAERRGRAEAMALLSELKSRKRVRVALENAAGGGNADAMSALERLNASEADFQRRWAKARFYLDRLGVEEGEPHSSERIEEAPCTEVQGSTTPDIAGPVVGEQRASDSIPMMERDRAILDELFFLPKGRGLTAKELAQKTGIPEGEIRGRVIPRLRKAGEWGIPNGGGGRGYYLHQASRERFRLLVDAN